jgi:hypothetical protein
MDRFQEDARREQLKNRPLKELIAIRDSYGLSMDPTQSYNLVDAIIEHERGMADTDRAIPGAVLEEAEEPRLTATEWLEEVERRIHGARGPQVVHVADSQDQIMTALRDMEEMAAGGTNLPFDALPGDSQIKPYDIRTSSGYFIYEVILPEVLRHFFSKNADYGDQHRTGLGLRAEFVGLHRKFAKLKSFFWDAKLMNHESGKEMLYDVIGQCLIMLDLMAQDESEEMPDPAAY